MTDHEQEGFEAQLRQLKPGKLPEELVVSIKATVSPGREPSTPVQKSASFLEILRWLIPATAAVILTAVIWHRHPSANEQGLSNIDSQANSVVATPIKPDNVQIGKELVSSFDAVATLPGGEPVRFRCQQWLTTVVVDDEKRGLLMESRSPRVIVVPVGFETY